MTTTSPTAVTTVRIQGTDAEQDVLLWFRQNRINMENMLGKKLKNMSITWTKDGETLLTYEEDVPPAEPAPTA